MNVKENICSYKGNAVTALKDVPIVQFNYSGDNVIKLGYITNEVDPPFTDNTKSKFEQGNCIALLIKAIQEIDDRLNKLEFNGLSYR